MTRYVVITIDLPVPDEADDDDAQELADRVSRLALVGSPSDAFQEALGDITRARPYGRVAEVRLTSNPRRV